MTALLAGSITVVAVLVVPVPVVPVLVVPVPVMAPVLVTPGMVWEIEPFWLARKNCTP